MSIPISKYTSYGNNFVLIDETQGRILDETETSGFAHEVTDINFGVGADNFLAVQRCTHQTLETINGHRSYWTESPDPDCADFIFRMFESDGTEAFSCGNGLMSIAKYLFQTYQIRQARILTEIPTRTPTVVAIGTESDGHASWARMPDPRRVPDDMAVQLPRTPINDRVDGISRIELNEIRRSDSIRFFSNATAVALSGALVFTGEPHLVVFADDGFNIEGIANQIFFSPTNKEQPATGVEKRAGSSIAFIDFIGKYFVREFSNLFPVGININFVRVLPDRQTIEHRCFERGINHETLSCGTGALASAYIAKVSGRVGGDKIIVRPHRCRWHLPDAELVIEHADNAWSIKGVPYRLFNGMFDWHR
ncbi:Diaminopimelate epimerase [Desulfosarcina cetonica]|nr:Diaminopimelate epimerase [Desulfosarcina cetonica]